MARLSLSLDDQPPAAVCQLSKAMGEVQQKGLAAVKRSGRLLMWVLATMPSYIVVSVTVSELHPITQLGFHLPRQVAALYLTQTALLRLIDDRGTREH